MDEEMQKPRATGLVDLNDEPLFEGDTVYFAYVDPMGRVRTDSLEHEPFIIKFDHAAFIAQKVGERYRVRVLRDFIETKEGEYVPNYGNPKVFVNNVLLAVKIK